MANLDRFGGAEAADAYYAALDTQREMLLRHVYCETCAHYHAAPIIEKIGWCDYTEDFEYGDLTAYESGCDEYE